MDEPQISGTFIKWNQFFQSVIIHLTNPSYFSRISRTLNKWNHFIGPMNNIYSHKWNFPKILLKNVRIITLNLLLPKKIIILNIHSCKVIYFLLFVNQISGAFDKWSFFWPHGDSTYRAYTVCLNGSG